LQNNLTICNIGLYIKGFLKFLSHLKIKYNQLKSTIRSKKSRKFSAWEDSQEKGNSKLSGFRSNKNRFFRQPEKNTYASATPYNVKEVKAISVDAVSPRVIEKSSNKNIYSRNSN